jgi:hypothetical protein
MRWSRPLLALYGYTRSGSNWTKGQFGGGLGRFRVDDNSAVGGEQSNKTILVRTLSQSKLTHQKSGPFGCHYRPAVALPQYSCYSYRRSLVGRNWLLRKPRSKGRTSLKSIERDFPHIVEIVVPLGGLGKTLDAIYDFHNRHHIRAHHGATRRGENGHNYMRWRFADPVTAVEFAGKFGGTMGQR